MMMVEMKMKMALRGERGVLICNVCLTELNLAFCLVDVHALLLHFDVVRRCSDVQLYVHAAT